MPRKQSMGVVALGIIACLLMGCVNDQQVSSSETQTLTSGVFLEHMDRSVNPADDFFAFVNGKWLAENEIPADRSSTGNFLLLRDQSQTDIRAIIDETAAGNFPEGSDEQKVGDFYKSFMDTKTRDQLGSSPLTGELAKINAIASYDDLAAYFGYADKVGFTAPLGLYISVDAKQPDQYAVYSWQTGLGLPDREYYFKDDTDSQKIREAYVTHIARMFELAGIEVATEVPSQIMALETMLAEHHWKKEDNRDNTKTYNKFDREKLGDVMPDFNWMAFLSETGVEQQPFLVLSQPSYLTALDGVIKSTSLDEWKNYLTWGLINSTASRLDMALDQQNFDFYGRTLSGTPEQRPMWRRGVSAVNGTLGEVVGKVYVDRHFNKKAKARMDELVQNLIKAYEVSIRDLDWMTDETKQAALVKLSKFTPKIGYPDIWKDYSALSIKADDYFGNMYRAALAGHDRQLAKLGGPIQKHEWFMTPQTVNAYYNPTMNEIVFPAAILQPPFFDLMADDAVNYGAIGGVIGHEIGHGFDDSGSRFNGDGALQNWWTDEDRAEFEKRTNVLIAQYGAFQVLEGLNVNGTFTLGENIGDLGGLSIAYKAYKMSLGGKEAPVIDGLTGDQRFFIGWAQAFMGKERDEALRQRILTAPHSPNIFRVNGVVRNVPAFYEAFDVKPGNTLYLPPEERVKIW